MFIPLAMKTIHYSALALITLGALQGLAHAQTGTQVWATRYNGAANGQDYATATATDAAGNVAVTGASHNGTNFDYYTVKYAAATGALLWEKRYNGPANRDDIAYSVVVDSVGDVIVTGISDPGGFFYDIYTAKYAAATGALLWEVRFNGPSGYQDLANAVIVDSTNNVLITGSSVNAVTVDYDTYTAKYAAATGALIWETRSIMGSSDAGLSIATNATGDVAITGRSHNGTDYDIYTAKYAGATGALLWEKQVNGPDSLDDEGHMVVMDAAGNVIVTGQLPNLGFIAGSYTAKYASADGALLWEQRPVGGLAQNGYAVALDSDGNVIATGLTRNAALIPDVFTTKYAAADGRLLWSNRYNGPGDHYDSAYAVKVDAGNNVTIAGQARNTSGNSDFYVARYSGVDGSLLWDARYDGPAGNDDNLNASYIKPGKLAVTANGGVVVTGLSSNGTNYDYATVLFKAPATTPLLRYNQWTASVPLSGADALTGAQPQGDGVANLLKYGFNLNASAPDSTLLIPDTGTLGLPIISRIGHDPMLKVEFLRRRGSGLIYTPQQSSTLAGFTPLTGPSVITNVDDLWEHVGVEEPLGTSPPVRLFTSVKVELPSLAGHLVINEVDYDQLGTDTAEFVELYNPTDTAIDLTNLALAFVNGANNLEYRRVNLAPAGTVPSLGYLVIAGNTVTVPPSATRYTPPGWVAQDNIQNGAPDGILLLNTATGLKVDALSYEGSIIAASVTGFPATFDLVETAPLAAFIADSNSIVGSLSRVPNGTDTDNSSIDWAFSTTPTPGAAN